MRILLSLIAVLMLSFGSLVAAEEAVPTPDLRDFDYFDTLTWELPDDAVEMRVDHVHDGDTIYLTEPDDDWYESYRLIGIQAPEIAGYKDEECFGPESAAFVKTLLPEGTRVWIQQDISNKDPNGRFLRHVFIEDAETGDIYLLSEVLVRGGYARARAYKPDDLYDDVLQEAQAYAWEHPTNMWTCEEWKSLIEK
ncbi:MAG: thermonuclease family protein [Thermomicrobiales bacterium]|nr:thermonuclease family protein [Thermomicrobiales bacterium]